jgi:Ca2+-binding RTX toxin-like protein
MSSDVRFEQDEGDEIYGDAGDDTLTGGVLDDLLVGGIGDDRLDGGGESQRYFLSSARSRDTLDGGQGADDYLYSGSYQKLKFCTFRIYRSRAEHANGKVGFRQREVLPKPVLQELR